MKPDVISVIHNIITLDYSLKLQLIILTDIYYKVFANH